MLSLVMMSRILICGQCKSWRWCLDSSDIKSCNVGVKESHASNFDKFEVGANSSCVSSEDVSKRGIEDGSCNLSTEESYDVMIPSVRTN